MAAPIRAKEVVPPNSFGQCGNEPTEGRLREVVECYLRPRVESSECANGTLSDLVGDAVLAVLERTRQKDSPPVENLAAYAWLVAQHKLDDYLRRLRPNYWSVQSSIRYFCSKDFGLELFEMGGLDVVDFSKRVCGKRLGPGTPELAQAVTHSANLKSLLGTFDPQRRGEILRRILEFAGGPVPVDLAIRVICLAQGLEDLQIQPLSEDEIATIGPSVQQSLSLQEELQELWRQVIELPIRQRAALLLQLRAEKGESLIPLLPLLKIATVEQIAATLSYSTQELAEIWGDLPLSDETIARRLGATSHQVSNLRIAARARLHRRMKAGGF